MQKILNDPAAFVDEMLDGIIAAHPGQLRRAAPRAIVRADAPVAGKVAIATGGGSGHLPVFMGYVGKGLIDGAAIGNVFASPSSDDMLEVTRAISAGKGVLFLYGNYGGDRLNFDLAAELAADDRTMLDALRPAADAVRHAAEAGSAPSIAAAEAAAAADAGARATGNMAAKVGRAGWLADRAAGHEDAGARLIALLFQAAASRLARN
jgi:dihydroxyacetone kinase